MSGCSVRLRIDLAYDGTDFSGWAPQPGRRTVAAVLLEALSTVLRTGELALVVAGRTDAGVHASGQVAHLDLPADAWSAVEQARLTRRLAGVLPADVRVRSIALAAPGFDARFAALWRRYEYRIGDGPGGVDPLRRRFVLAWPRRLDEAAMHAAAQRLIGLHDFASFCKRREGGTTVRTLQVLDIARVDAEVVATVRADAFCHSMVRSLIGALIAVGEGRRPVEWPAALLDGDRRAQDVAVAAAHGLNLLRVEYPLDDELAARVERTRAKRM